MRRAMSRLLLVLVSGAAAKTNPPCDNSIMTQKPPTPPLPPIYDLGRALEKDAAVLQQQSARTAKLMSQAVESFASSVRQSYGNYIAELERVLKEDAVSMQADASKTALDIASHGWYPDPTISMYQVKKVIELYRNGNAAKADLMLGRHYSRHNEDVEREVTAAFSRRKRIVRSAFWAHRQRQNALSVPVMLAQADGICVDELGGELFQRDQGKPRTAKAIAKLDGAAAAFLAPLTAAIPVMASVKERASLPPGELYRHTILHGESVDYDTHVNSCKAMSLLRYLAWLLPEARKSHASVLAAPTRL